MKSTFVSLVLALSSFVLSAQIVGGGDGCIDPSLIDPNGSCFGVFDPVCGCDGVTYTNECFAQLAGVVAFVPGECGISFVLGCTSADACNFNPAATIDDGSCQFPPFGFDCDGNCNLDLNQNGLCDYEEVVGCTYTEALNYQPAATLDNGSCLFACDGDFNGDGNVGAADLLVFLAKFGTECEVLAENACTMTTPQAHANGLLCTANLPHAVVLFTGTEHLRYTATDATFWQDTEFTAQLTANLLDQDDPTRGWLLSVELMEAKTWSEWSTQAFPASYRDDCNLVGDNYLDWTYYLLAPGSTMTGTGANAGQVLQLAHAPANNFFAAQLGHGANNVNTAYGVSGWFTFSGGIGTAAGSFYFDVDCQ
ncbi:MAG: hypothetical protein ACFCUH_03065 [Flavobacteriales bacterium]